MVAEASSNFEGRLNDVELAMIDIDKQISSPTKAIENLSLQFSSFTATQQSTSRVSTKRRSLLQENVQERRVARTNNTSLPGFMGDDSDSYDEDEEIFQESHSRNPRRPTGDQDFQDQPDYKIKMDLPPFNGRMDIERFLDWVKNVENFFAYTNTAEKKKVHLVAYKLQSGASAWCKQIENNRRYYGKPPIEVGQRC